MHAHPTDDAEDQLNIFTLNTLIARASSELESDPNLRRAVLLGLIRSLQEPRQPQT